jgi:hypothetical protein
VANKRKSRLKMTSNEPVTDEIIKQSWIDEMMLRLWTQLTRILLEWQIVLPNLNKKEIIY